MMDSWRVTQDLLLFGKQPVPLTWSNLAVFLAPAFFTYYAMAVLVQLPRTKLYRIALLPLVLWLALRAGVSLDFSGKQPRYAFLNKGLASSMCNLAMRATAWTLVDEPYVKIDHDNAGSSIKIADKANSEPSTTSSNNIHSAMLNASDLCYNLRGIGWSWSKRVHIRSPTIKTESRLVFVVLSLGRSLLYMFIGDALDLCVRAFAPQGSAGWPIFDLTLPPIRRYLRSSVITVLVGFSGVTTIEMVYSFNTAVCVVLFQQRPSQWPPLFNNPWFSTSLAKFWGQNWHQLFRDIFVGCGYKPLEGILGQYAVIGAFVVSGILHDVAMRGMGHGDTLRILGYFVMQGVGVVLERLWRRLTGRRVGGPLGCLWVWIWQCFWGNHLVDAWAQGGMIARSELFPVRPVSWALNSAGLLASQGS
ncbi:membrane bound O-acyl transferase family-domain-containing protein [Pisolithus marmoratus]|nr:membrane bound O-acyl transferase family-domain-containing protein [Pisolithus marmoratus]